MKTVNRSARKEMRLARAAWGEISPSLKERLIEVVTTFGLSIRRGELLLLNGSLYVTHGGLLRIATERRCSGIHAIPITKLCDPRSCRYAFRATVYVSRTSRGFSGYGDADPSTVSPTFRGCEMRIAETRAVNRALRKAYGIGICSVEEIGSAVPSPGRDQAEGNARKLPPDSANGNGSNGHTGNGNGIRLRDRLCQLIRQHT